MSYTYRDSADGVTISASGGYPVPIAQQKGICKAITSWSGQQVCLMPSTGVLTPDGDFMLQAFLANWYGSPVWNPQPNQEYPVFILWGPSTYPSPAQTPSGTVKVHVTGPGVDQTFGPCSIGLGNVCGNAVTPSIGTVMFTGSGPYTIEVELDAGNYHITASWSGYVGQQVPATTAEPQESESSTKWGGGQTHQSWSNIKPLPLPVWRPPVWSRTTGVTLPPQRPAEGTGERQPLVMTGIGPQTSNVFESVRAHEESWGQEESWEKKNRRYLWV